MRFYSEHTASRPGSSVPSLSAMPVDKPEENLQPFYFRCFSEPFPHSRSSLTVQTRHTSYKCPYFLDILLQSCFFLLFCFVLKFILTYQSFFPQPDSKPRRGFLPCCVSIASCVKLQLSLLSRPAIAFSLLEFLVWNWMNVEWNSHIYDISEFSFYE